MYKKAELLIPSLRYAVSCVERVIKPIKEERDVYKSS